MIKTITTLEKYLSDLENSQKKSYDNKEDFIYKEGKINACIIILAWLKEEYHETTNP